MHAPDQEAKGSDRTPAEDAKGSGRAPDAQDITRSGYNQVYTTFADCHVEPLLCRRI